MTDAHYTPFAEGILAGEIDLDTAVIKCALVRGYTFSASHKFVSDVLGAGGTLNGTSAALASKSVTGGVFDAADTVVAATASAVNHTLILFQASAVTGGSDVANTAQRLIAHYDSDPIQPGTGDVDIVWNSGTNKILKVG